MSDVIEPDLSQAQMFLDDALIADQARLQRRWHPARKHPEPVLRPDRPWEGRMPVMYGTVLRREGRFQMWYCTSAPAPVIQVCYAESDDGLTWRKPDLGLFEYDGSRKNNICLAPTGNYIDDISIIDDPDDDAWPLKALFWERFGRGEAESGIRAARSKDGLRWDVLPGFVLPWGDRFNAMPHRDGGKFVILGRDPVAARQYGQDRLVSRAESDDLVHWSDPVLIHRPSLKDAPQMRIYSATAFRHEGRLMGFLERMHMSPDVLDSELTWSEDGLHWSRTHEAAAFIKRGAPLTWDGAWASLNSGPPILNQGRLWFYYSGRSGAHATPYPCIGAFGMATLRRDGFCSIDAGQERGILETVPIRWQGEDLLVNVDTRRDDRAHPNYPSGRLVVEVRDESGRAIEGCGEGDCEPVTVNTERRSATCYAPVRWRGNRRLGALEGRAIRLRFVFQDASLYAFKSGQADA